MSFREVLIEPFLTGEAAGHHLVSVWTDAPLDLQPRFGVALIDVARGVRGGGDAGVAHTAGVSITSASSATILRLRKRSAAYFASKRQNRSVSPSLEDEVLVALSGMRNTRNSPRWSISFQFFIPSLSSSAARTICDGFNVFNVVTTLFPSLVWPLGRLLDQFRTW